MQQFGIYFLLYENIGEKHQSFTVFKELWITKTIF